MLIKIVCGMNVPDKQGGVTIAYAGDVVDVPPRFGRQQIAVGRAMMPDADGVELEHQEDAVRVKLKKG